MHLLTEVLADHVSVQQTVLQSYEIWPYAVQASAKHTVELLTLLQAKVDACKEIAAKTLLSGLGYVTFCT